MNEVSKNQVGAVNIDRQKIDAILDEAQKTINRDSAATLALCERAVILCREGNFRNEPYKAGLARADYLVGVVHFQSGAYDEALSRFLNAASCYEPARIDEEMGAVVNMVGVTYLQVGNYPEALSFLLRALDIFKAVKSTYRMAKILNNIGIIHRISGDTERALQYFQDSLKIARELDDVFLQANVLNQLCKACTTARRYDEALQAGKESIFLYRQLDQLRGEAEAMTSVGKLYLEQDNFEQALAYFTPALEMANLHGFRDEAAAAYQAVGEMYLCQNELDKARFNLQKALEIASEAGIRQLAYSSHQVLADLEKQAGNFKEALDHYARFHEIKESVFNENADRRLKNLEISYQVDAARRESEIYHLKNVALQHEIYSRKVIEESLQHANSQLQREVGIREQLIGELDAFSHTVAHDLKNPLQRLVFAAQLLNTEEKSCPTPQGKEYIDIILKTADKMNAIVEELLLLSSVRQQEIKREHLDMVTLVDEAQERLSDIILSSRATIIKPETWPAAVGYAPWVEEVLVNYLSNAVKYGGKPPLVELGAEQLQPGQVVFWVKDNGNGIKLEDQEHLFTPFNRLGQAKVRGYGLGLSIVKRIVEKLGGTVGLESSGIPGEGSKFTFSLPTQNGNG